MEDSSHNRQPPVFSLIIPVYRNEATLLALLERIESLAGRLSGRLEAVFVIDGSPDNSHALLAKELKSKPFAFDSQLIQLARNFGSFAAIRTGLSAARGVYFAVMAADLQEPADLVLQFFDALQHEPVDVTLGVRKGRADPFKDRVASWVFWHTYRLLVQPEVPSGGIDVFGCNRAVRDVLISLHEANSTLVGLLLWIGFRRKCVHYSRLPRPEGKSGWSLSRKVKYMMDSAYAFSDLPVRLLLLIGSLGTVGALTASFIVLTGWALGLVTVKGYTPIVLSILLSTSVILFSLGLIGGYVWRAFENSKNRPLHIAMSHDLYEKDEADELFEARKGDLRGN